MKYDASVNLSFTTNPVAFSYAAPLYGKATLTAGNSIAITGELAVPAENELVMETNRAALLQCSPAVITAVGPTTCIANTWALRASGKAESPPPGAAPVRAVGWVELAPNPATSSTTAMLRGGPDEYIEQVEVLNLRGQRVWSSVRELLRRERQVAIPLLGLPTGLYVVRLVSTARSYSQKLQVE